MGDVYRFPGGEMPPDFETKMPDDIEVQHCYRHRDRETGVSCSNCGRPICHECMIPAPVGFRCPECVKEQSVRGSRAKVVTRGQIRSRWSSGALGGSAGVTATKVLIALNVIMFVLELAVSSIGAGAFTVNPTNDALIKLGGLINYASDAPNVLVTHQYWRMITSTFLHGGIFHILLNMWALWVMGAFMEAAIGRFKFVLLYLISGFAGSVLVLAIAPVPTLVVGASGAIFGLFGALAVHAFFNRGRDFQSSAFLRQIMFLIVINLVFSFLWSGISWQAHIGGLIGGAATMTAMTLAGRKDPRRPFELADGLAVAGVVVVLLVITAVRVVSFTL
jgi:membrane associated rhomboid family serine protease